MTHTLKTTLNQIPQTAKDLAGKIKGGEVFALVGPLGSGKTTFTQALGRELKIKQKITSPTFILLQAFPFKINPVRVGKNTRNQNRGGKFKSAASDNPVTPSDRVKAKKELWMYHLDLYRTQNFKEVKALGLLEVWGRKDTITVIEWADKIKKYLPKATKIIKFVG